jgi:adenylate cyclase
MSTARTNEEKARRILLIEDDPTVALLETAMLEEMGHVVKQAATGAEGLDNISKWLPDLLVLDLNLPDTTGHEIIRKILTLKIDQRPEIIVVTGEEKSQVAFEALRGGANDLLRKPFEKEEFQLRVSAVLALRDTYETIEELQLKTRADLIKLSKYFSNDVIDAILEGKISSEPGGEITRATFMMFDLRGSTTIAEKLGPQKFFVFLSELFSDIADLIFSNGGKINKFTGDGFLVTFGLRHYTEADTHHALNCAFKIREHFNLYNEFVSSEQGEPIQFGIGLTTGDVFAGNIGNVHRVEYTILGDAVNLSARLEALTKKAGVDSLMDSTTREILGDSVEATKYSGTTIRGKNSKVDIYFPKAARAQ